MAQAAAATDVRRGYTRISAPIAGRIGKSAVTSGALVTADQADSLATIQQLDPICVDLTQSSQELLRMRAGERVVKEGLQKIQDGMPVYAEPAAAENARCRHRCSQTASGKQQPAKAREHRQCAALYLI